MKPVPIVYVTDMDRSFAWYRALLPRAAVISASPAWTELSCDGVPLALHGAASVTPGTQVGLAFEASRPLEELVDGLAAAGIVPARGISDEVFGRSLLLQDPDGLKIQVNEHDPQHYPEA